MRLAALSLAALLTACGGGSDTPPSAAGIGPAGGTVGSGGASVVVPAGALAGMTPIAVAPSSAGAPALPAGVTPVGPVFAFTPHGSTFATPVTITVPFDRAQVPAGTTLALYKTDAQNAWQIVPGATMTGNAMSGPVSGFSWALVAPAPPSVVLAGEAWHAEMVYTAANAAADVLTVLPTKTNDARALRDCYPAGYCWEYPPLELDLPIAPKNILPIWGSMVEATADGGVFSVSATAPAGDPFKAGQPIGLNAALTVTRVLRKVSDAASTRATFTQATFELIDGNPFAPFANYCPWRSTTEAGWECLSSMLGTLELVVDAWVTLPNGGYVTLRHAEATARIAGWRSHFYFSADTNAGSDRSVWSSDSFAIVGNDPANQGQTASARLFAPVSVDIPLSGVERDGEFTVQVTLKSFTYNRRHGESYVGTYFRDPATNDTGVAFVDDGVEVVTAPAPRPAPVAPPPPPKVPAPACPGGPDPAAGTLQLGSPNFQGYERVGAKTAVKITRAGGSQGAASVWLTTADGNARSGIDYVPVNTLVRFEDGESGARVVDVPIIDNDTVDGDRTVLLSIGSIGGCAALGAQSTATLVIYDNDAPPPPVTFSVSGTVSGLVGSGLVLRDVLGGTTTRPMSDGTYVLAPQVVDGTGYDIVVDTQPGNPAQACSVARGTGTIAGANVTDVAVTCTAIVANGSLDTTFAGTGKVSNAFPAARAIALQGDGKILAAGSMTLSRYNADGSLDTTFGGGSGKVTVVANGGPLDAMQAVAVQPDGRIVVAGSTSLPTASNDDFAILRFNADGTPDTSFNGTGKVVVDFAGLTDRAFAVLVQGDGSIVAAGFATLGTLATANQDVAVVRLLANGALDPAFGSGGKATINVAGRGDFGYAAQLQSDGKIVVVGRVADDGGANPDFGIVRLQSNGAPDTGFGANGMARVDFGGAVWDEAADVVIQPDGAIVVGGFTQTAGVYRFALARLTSAGALDATFGSGGLVSTPFSGSGDFGRALALQGDGKIVVAGQIAATTTNPDVGIARYTSGGAPDGSFGTGGLVRVDFFGAIDNANDVLLQPDGRIVAGGSARNGTTTGLGLVRVMP